MILPSPFSRLVPAFALSLVCAAMLALPVAPITGAALAQAPTHQARINVTPLRLDLPSDREAVQIVMRNRGERPLAVQLRVFEWLQEGGEDRYVPSREVVVSPAIAEVGTELARTFHVVYRGERVPGEERRFRVVIDELPDGEAPVAGVARTRLRLTIPLFAGSDTVSTGEIELAARDGSLLIGNRGGRTVKLTDLELEADGAPVDLGHEARLKYVHGGSWIAIPLPAGITCRVQRLTLTAQANGSAVNAVANQDCS
ncbi:molecular chaperone [Qipengyuania nanhaisediminis]|uniref:fimbrial biogenesis chaperone n=1 Tax=Qipengyuania nanhaisediminis TaxID=604088 RepID=UPI0038B3D741